MMNSGEHVAFAGLGALEHFMAAGEMVAAQGPVGTTWTPEKKLAATVLSSALIEIRDHAGDPAWNRVIRENLEWVLSDDVSWPYSFRRLCEAFELDPDWVRRVVLRWARDPRAFLGRQGARFRHAA